MKRKQKSDSVTSAVKAHAAAGSAIPVPEFVTFASPGAESFWPVVVRARAKDEWTDVDLTVAGNLCDCMADMRREGASLEAEGYVVDGKQNPRNQVLEVLTRRKVALIRLLQMQGRAVNGTAARLQAQRKAERAAAATFNDPDGLLA
jgi:hypothetical protein